MKKIISLVGISLFDNFFNKNPNHGFIDEYEHLKKNDYNYAESINQSNRIKNVRGAISIDNENASAEIRSIIEIAKKESDTEFSVHLIATDTVLSVLAAELICEWFEINKPSNLKDCKFVKPENPKSFAEQVNQSNGLHVIKDLRIDKKETFENGFMNLVNVLETLIKKEETILNITGGYKAIIPIVTLLGQLKEVPLKYIYKETDIGDTDGRNTDSLIEIGNLPFGLDWAVVEAIKPFLRNSFLENKQKIIELGKIWNEDKTLKFSNGKFISEDYKYNETLNSINQSFHQILNSLINYRLIYYNLNYNKFVKSPLGTLVQNFSIPIESNKGYIMEHLLFKYFATNSKDNLLTNNYSTNFEFPNMPKKQKVNGEDVEIGDMDVFLTYRDDNKCFNVWGEAKALSAAEGYSEPKAGDKYYKQLKARILGYSQNQQFLEKLFIVFRFVIKGINDNDPFLTDNLKKSLCRFQKLNQDTDIQTKGKFKCLGVSIPAKFSGNKIDLTESFYKGDFQNWKWEELNVDNADC